MVTKIVLFTTAVLFIYITYRTITVMNARLK